MRIHLPLDPALLAPSNEAGPSHPALPPPLVQLGGDIVLVELQGQLECEGDQAGGVVGILGFDRPDKPTLHLGAHHLLHGKIVTLPKPYAVIRRAAVVGGASAARAIEGDADAEESDAEREGAEAVTTPKRARAGGAGRGRPGQQRGEEEDEDEAPLFEPNEDIFGTPARPAHVDSSSPFPSSARDYSSELDPTSPYRLNSGGDDDDDDGAAREVEAQRRLEERKRERREKRKREGGERTRHYEVVAVVRKKVVFALRPEPIVTATILPD
ncbi:hypothetical protein Q5752_003013 [Cryptotrichosporon argae]